MPGYVMTIRVEMEEDVTDDYFALMSNLAFIRAETGNVDCSFGPASEDDLSLLPHAIQEQAS